MLLPTLYSMNNIDPVDLLDSAETYRFIDLDKSRQFIDQLLSITSPSELNYCEGIRSKSIAYFYEGKMDSAAYYNQKLPYLECYQKSALIQFKYRTFKAKIVNQNGEIDQALSLYDEALELAKKYENVDWKIEAYGGMGVVNYRVNKYKEAIYFYLQAEELFDQTNELNPVQQCNIVHNIGASFNVIGDHKRAEKHLKQALELSQDRQVQKIHCLFSLGSLYINMDSLELANEILKESIILNDFNPYFKAFSYAALADLLIKEKPQEAKKYAEDAYATFSKMEDHLNAAISTHIISEVLLNEGKYQTAQIWIEKNKIHSAKSKSPEEINRSKLLELEYLLHVNVGTESATELKNYQRTSDSLSQVLLNGEILQMEQDKEMRKAVDSIQTLQLSVSNYQSKTFLNRNLIGLLCLLLPGLFFLGLKFRNQTSTTTNEETDNDKEHNNKNSTAQIENSILENQFIIEGDKKIHTTFGDIASVQAKSGGIEVKLIDGTTSFLWTSLAKYIQFLPSEYFIRISKFYIVNVAQVDTIVDLSLKLKNGEEVKFSPAYKEQFFEAYSKLKNN